MSLFTEYVEKYTNSTNTEIIIHLRASGLLLNQLNCPSCENLLIEKLVKRNIDGVMFRCLNMSCEKYQSYFSIRIESFFENFKVSLHVFFLPFIGILRMNV